MKACPVCKAQAFEDAEVCYGCLYRFEWGDWENEPDFLADLEDDLRECADEYSLEDPKPPRLDSYESVALAKVQPMATVLSCSIEEDEGLMEECVSAPSSETVVIRLRIQHPVVGMCSA